MKNFRWSIPLAVFVLLVAFLWVGLGRDPREVPSPLIGKPAPPFKLAQLHAPDTLLSNDDLKGKVWLLNVWASWCVSCRVEHPLLVQLAKANIVPVYGLDYKDKPDDGRAWLAQNGYASTDEALAAYNELDDVYPVTQRSLPSSAGWTLSARCPFASLSCRLI